MLLTLLTFIVVLGVLVFVHELGHFLAAKWNGVKVEEFAFGFKPRLFSKKVGETNYAINLIPLGGYVRMYGEDGDGKGERAYNHKKPWRKLTILLAGIFMNLLLGWLILVALFINGFQPAFSGVAGNKYIDTFQTVTVEKVAEKSPAETAGLKIGDVLVSVQGERVATSQEFIVLISQNKGRDTKIHILRSGQEGEITAVPRTDPPAGQGALGVTVKGEGDVRTAWYKSPQAAFIETGKMAVISAKGFIGFVENITIHQKVSDDVTGIIGIGAMTGQARQMGWSYLLQLIAIISIGLGVINVVPLVPLDGGHAAITIYEAITRRKVTEKQMNALFIFGLAFVIFLFVVVTYKDLIRFNIFGRIFR